MSDVDVEDKEKVENNGIEPSTEINDGQPLIGEQPQIVNTNELDSKPEDSKQQEIVSIKSIDDKIIYSKNVPYQLVDILKETPLKFSDNENSKITYVEAWELNLYIGTNQGELIHFYKIDDELGYIQISKQSFSSNSTKPIKKIILLTEISIAIVHCGSTVSGYLLPELSPANIGKAKEVNDISVDCNDIETTENKGNQIVKTEDYGGDKFSKVTIFTEKSIKLLRIFRDSIRLHKELQYSHVKAGLQMSNFSIVANLENYDLVDVSQSQRIFLFPLSTNHEGSNLKPIIKCVSKKEALLVCGGSDVNSPAVGMFINLNGDVVRGTLTFESYPSAISIAYPHVLAILKNKVVVYSIFDQQKLQEIQFADKDNNINLNVFPTMKIFEIKDSNLIEMIVQSPIISTMDNKEIERIAIESDTAIKNAICKTSYVLVDSMGNYVKMLKPLSQIERWIGWYDQSNSENAQNIYDKLVEEFSVNKSNKFLITLLGFYSISYGLFNQAFEIWTSNFKTLDPRLMIYIFERNGSDGIIGSVWTFQSLFEKVENLKKIEKSEEMIDFFKLYLNTSLTISFKTDTVDIGKSLEIALVKLGLTNNEDLEPVIHEIKYATNEIIELLLLNKKYFLLSRFYSKLKDHAQLLYYWKGLIEGQFKDEEFDKNFNDTNKSLQYLLNYIFTNCVDNKDIIEKYSEWLLELYPKFGLKLVTDKRINQLDINDIKILNILNNEKSNDKDEFKLEYLEHIFQTNNEKQFIGDLLLLYLELMINEFENVDKVHNAVKETINSYLKSDIPKPSIFKYWNLMETMELKNTKFCKYHNKLLKYINSISIGMKSVLDQRIVMNACKKKIIDTKYSKKFPLISIIILFKFNEFEKIVDEFIELKDYTSAEDFAINLNFQSIGIAGDSLKSIKMSTNTSSLVDDDLVNPAIAAKDNKVTEGLLKKIFDVYLEANETKLIDNFLNKYDLLNDTTENEISTLDRMDKFVELIDKVPDNFPVDRLKRFMVNNLIEFKDYNDHINIRKTLIKVEVNRMLKLENKLKKG